MFTPDERSRFDLGAALRIDRYNVGGSSTENYFDELVKFAESLKEEDERAARERLIEDELEIFDILKKEKMIKDEVQVEDWYKDIQTQARTRLAQEEVLDKTLPESYDTKLFQSS